MHPLTILSTLPSAGCGSTVGIAPLRLDLDIVGIIGIILLIGIVKKNGIMMVDFALDAERHHGLGATEAIYQASLLRFRPIMMTTMAALFSGIPLAFGSGIGSELRRPLGVAMVGGLIFSQVLTLYTTPVIYIFFDNLGARFLPVGNVPAAPRSSSLRPTLRTGPRRRTHEPFADLHRASRSHHAAHYRYCHRGRDRVQRASSLAAATGGLPHHHRRRIPPRSQPGHHGVVGGYARSSASSGTSPASRR